MSGGSVLWFATRGSGAVALVLLTIALVVGIGGSLRWRSARWPSWAVTHVHRNLTLLAVAFVAVHVLTTVADGYAPVRLQDALIPFASAYRPFWVGLGAVAFDLVLALVATSLLRRRLGFRLWRAVHWLAYASWPVALVHALGAGSDARLSWLVVVAVTCAVAVAGAGGYRIVRARASRGFRLGAAAASGGVALALALWYSGGPGQPGWAARAGTPASLLHHARVAAAPEVVLQALPASFSGRLAGRLAQSSDAGGDVGIAFAANVSGDVRAVLRLTLWGQALVGGGLSLTQSSVTFSPAGARSSYTGQVVELNGAELVAQLGDAAGRPLRLDVVLGLRPDAPTFTGSLRGRTR